MIGPGIQKNKYALPAVTLRVFNVLNVDAYRLLDHAADAGRAGGDGAGVGAAARHAGAEPHGGRAGRLLRGDERAQPEGPARRASSCARSAEEYDEDIGGRLSFKAINPKFLLKYDE